MLPLWLLGFGISLFLLFLSLWRGPHKPDKEKQASYECGFEPLSDTHHRFDIRYYLVGILFILFDVEIAFLFPWAVSLKEMSLFGFLSMILFLCVLTVGFIYEWCKGALEWD